MKHLPKSIQRAIDEFSKLPGVGGKTAGRLVFHLIRQSSTLSETLGQALVDLRSNLVFCDECFNIADQTPCVICSDARRDGSVLCVVEQPLDTVAIEKTDYQGKYHVLGGAISPIDGIGPNELRIQALIDRVRNHSEVKELILATNPSLEGEATALYIQKLMSEQLAGKTPNMSRIAHGLPVGGDLEYADAVTLTRAIEGRRAYSH
jgi:recombination protein RecR